MSDGESSFRDEEGSVEEFEEVLQSDGQYDFDVAPMSFNNNEKTDYTSWFDNRKSENFGIAEHDNANVVNQIEAPPEPRQLVPENAVSPVAATVAGQRRSIDRVAIQPQLMAERLPFINEEADSIDIFEADNEEREEDTENINVDDKDEDKDVDKENIGSSRRKPALRVRVTAYPLAAMATSNRQVPSTSRSIPMGAQTLPRAGRTAQEDTVFPHGVGTMNRLKPGQLHRTVNNSASHGERLKFSKPPTKPISPKLATKKRAEDRAARQNREDQASSSTAMGAARGHPTAVSQGANRGTRNARGASTMSRGQTKPSRF